jgi:hypothetical protein
MGTPLRASRPAFLCLCDVSLSSNGSWFNLVETLFNKMTRSFLRGLRVS